MTRTARTIRHSIVVLAIGGGIAVGAAAASPALAATRVGHLTLPANSARIIPDPCNGSCDELAGHHALLRGAHHSARIILNHTGCATCGWARGEVR